MQKYKTRKTECTKHYKTKKIFKEKKIAPNVDQS
jgi:hypothetical protein